MSWGVLVLQAHEGGSISTQRGHAWLTSPPLCPAATTSPLQDELKDEVRDMAKKLGAAGMQLLVIDTGEQREWEGMAGGACGQIVRPAGAWRCVRVVAPAALSPPSRCFLLLPPPAENKFVSTGFAEEIAKAANGEGGPPVAVVWAGRS